MATKILIKIESEFPHNEQMWTSLIHITIMLSYNFSVLGEVLRFDGERDLMADLICDEVWSFKLQVTISHISPHPLDSTKGNMTQWS